MTAPPASRTQPREVLAWLVLGVVAWTALVVLGVAMYTASNPPLAGFDLELLLQGGRRAAAGVSPYDAGLIAGQPVGIRNLFYSYPPPVAQAMALVAAVPSSLVLAAWVLGASAAAVAVGALVERRLSGTRVARHVVPTAALLPLWFPFAIALLFGNLDAWFAALFGLLLVGAMATEAGTDGRRRTLDLVGAGVALAVASIAKLHPASLGLWFLVRGIRERRDGSARVPPSWLVLGTATACAGAVVLASLAVGGGDPWIDYVAVIRAGTNVNLLDPLNLGPAAQLSLLAGLGADGVRTLQPAVTLAAGIGTAVVGWRVRDPVESLAWAAVASFVVLPVTWVHYPAALVPFAVAAVVRADAVGAVARRRTRLLLVAALALGIAGLGNPLLWLAVLAVLLAVRVSRPAPLVMAVAPASSAAARA
jgi:hypothetical protein